MCPGWTTFEVARSEGSEPPSPRFEVWLSRTVQDSPEPVAVPSGPLYGH
jgi:hypothetical protein